MESVLIRDDLSDNDFLHHPRPAFAAELLTLPQELQAKARNSAVPNILAGLDQA